MIARLDVRSQGRLGQLRLPLDDLLVDAGQGRRIGARRLDLGREPSDLEPAARQLLGQQGASCQGLIRHQSMSHHKMFADPVGMLGAGGDIAGPFIDQRAHAELDPKGEQQNREDSGRQAELGVVEPGHP